MNQYSYWLDWEVVQRRDALISLVESYADIKNPSRRHQVMLRRYTRELEAANAEIVRRRDARQLDLFELSVLDSLRQ